MTAVADWPIAGVEGEQRAPLSHPVSHPVAWLR